MQEEFLTVEEMDTWVMLKHDVPSAFDYVFEWLLGNVPQEEFPFTEQDVDMIFAAHKESRNRKRYEFKKTR